LKVQVTRTKILWKSTRRCCPVKGHPNVPEQPDDPDAEPQTSRPAVRWTWPKMGQKDSLTQGCSLCCPTKGRWLQLEGTVLEGHNPGSGVCADGKNTPNLDLLPHTLPGSLQNKIREANPHRTPRGERRFLTQDMRVPTVRDTAVKGPHENEGPVHQDTLTVR